MPQGDTATLKRKTGRDLEGLDRFSLAEATGFEPAISALTGLHVRPLHHASNSPRNVPSPGPVDQGFGRFWLTWCQIESYGLTNRTYAQMQISSMLIRKNASPM
jgi:hypothetical protein